MTTSSSDTEKRPRFSISPTLAICMIAAAVAVVGLFAPSLSPVTTSAEPAAEAPTVAVAADAPLIEIVDFSFAGDLVVQPGQVIRVVNVDGAPHSVTADDGSFDTGVLDGGAEGTFVAPTAEGTYSFFCIVHPSMTAQLTVTSS